jgi:hypothetical protein
MEFTSEEALEKSIAEKSFIDIEYMAKLTKKSKETLLIELQKKVFLNIGCAQTQDETYATLKEYTSGNYAELIKKIKFATAAAMSNPYYQINVDVLEMAMFMQISAHRKKMSTLGLHTDDHITLKNGLTGVIINFPMNDPERADIVFDNEVLDNRKDKYEYAYRVPLADINIMDNE